MPTEVRSRVVLSIASEDDAVLVRRRVRELAQQHGFDSFAVAALTTAASELARNVWRHGGGGEAAIEIVQDESRSGLRMEMTDRGPGIADVDRALSGGFSTVRSLGLGLSGSRRLVDDFELETAVGKGTRVQVTKWKRD